MNILFAIIFALSNIVIFVYAILAIVQFVKKNKTKAKKHLKFLGISLGVMIVSLVGFGTTLSSTENEKVETVAEAKEQKETPEEKAAREAKEAEEKAAIELKEKEEAEAKAKAEQEAKADTLAKEVKYYQDNVSSQLDSAIKEYDRLWNEIWVTTFNGVSDGSVDVYTAYSQMANLETGYSLLSQQISEIKGDNLSKENKSHLNEFKSKLTSASTYRQMAANDAAEMFDNGTFKPSELDSIKSIVSAGDGDMMSAVVSRLSIEENLGLTEQTE